MGEYQFQKDNIEWLNRQYKEKNRLLIADETGLGKTYTAAGIIAKLAEDKRAQKPKDKFWVLYICSGQIIARKNMPELIRKIHEIGMDNEKSNNFLISKSDIIPMSSGYDARLSMKRKEHKNSYVQIVNATPGTSFKKIGGTIEEIKQLAKNGQIKLGDSLDILDEESKNKLYEERKKRTQDLLSKNAYDLVILDEFQSYEEILSEELKDNREIVLTTVDELFPSTKILMLSATPYKINKDGLTIEAKLSDFKKVLTFLSGVQTTTPSLVKKFEEYQEQLMATPLNSTALLKAKTGFEEVLRNYVRRNQRQFVMDKNDFYTCVIKKSGDYSEAYIAEKNKVCKLSEKIDSKNSCDEGNNIEEKDRVLLSLSAVRNYPYPPSFVKGYKAWESGIYTDCDELYPEMTKWEGDGFCKNCLQKDKHVSENIELCEKIYSRENVSFPKNISCALNCIEEIIGEKKNEDTIDSIYKIAWIPPSSSDKLKPPFSDVPAYFSKLLVFSGNIPETRCIATYFSAKAFCKETGNLENVRKVLEELDKQDKSQNPLYQCVKCAIGESEPLIIEIWYASLLEYFKREEVIHVLANAGIKSIEELEKYIEAGDLGAVIIEYMSTINFTIPQCGLTINNSEKLTEIILNHIHENISEYIQKCITEILEYEYECQDSNCTIFEESKARVKLTRDQFALLEAVHRGEQIADDLKYLINEKKATAYGLDGARDYRLYLNDCKRPFERDDHFCAKECVIDQIRVVSEVFGYNSDGSSKNVEVRYDNVGKKSTKMKHFTPSSIGVELVLGDTGLFVNNGYLNLMVDYLQNVKGKGLEFYPESKVCVASKHKKEDNGYEIGCGRMPVGFSMRLTDAIQDVEDSNEEGMQKIINAFNSPFYPFVLATTDVAKEGISLHTYCRKILHLNMREQAAVMIQRNGRIDRYNSLAIRQRIAYNHTREGKAPINNWAKAYESYCKDSTKYNDKDNGMIPHWYVPAEGDESPKIEEYRYYNSASSELFKLKNAENNISIYKSVIGSFLPEEAIYNLKMELSDEEMKQLSLSLV